MKINELKTKLHNILGGRFSERGFTLRKANFEYIQKIDDIISIFAIGIHSKTDWFLITPSVFVGSAKINKKYNEIIGRNIQVSGSTCGFGIGNEHDNKRGRYNADKEADISPAAEAILADFLEVALPFLNRVNSLEAIDKYINTIKKGVTPTVSVSNACFGLIVANAVNNPQFSEIANTYYEFWSKAQSPEIAKDIIAVRDTLIGTTAITRG